MDVLCSIWLDDLAIDLTSLEGFEILKDLFFQTQLPCKNLHWGHLVSAYVMYSLYLGRVCSCIVFLQSSTVRWVDTAADLLLKQTMAGIST